MQKQPKILQSIAIVAFATAAILTILLVAMQFTEEVKWSVADFIVMGILIFNTGTAFILTSRHGTNLAYKAGVAGAIGTTFLMIWANLAVGLIGFGAHVGNLMYMGVVAVVIIGTFLSHFKAKGLELSMFASAISLVLLAVIALAANMQEYPASSVTEIIVVNGFFAFLYLVSGLLFRFVALNQQQEHSTSS